MMPFKIDADQISKWFSSSDRRAQELLPGLVSRLVNATIATKGFRFPEGNLIRLHGPDGRTQLKEGSDFSPDGSGLWIWEVGTSAGIRQKADADFAKPPPADVDPQATTYIAVTPHVWADKDAWCGEKRTEGKWHGVRAVDATDLHEWLKRAPAVKRWLMAEMGVPVTGIRAIDLFWGELSRKYNYPMLSADIIVGGRSEAEKEILACIENRKQLIAIQGESPEEACAFAAAVVHGASGELGDVLKSRTVFIDNQEGADWVSGLQAELLVIPTTVEARRRVLALNSPNLHVVDPRDRHGPGRDVAAPAIPLGSVNKDACGRALATCGTPQQDAARVATQSKGSLTALLWGLSLGPDTALPWTTGTAAADLLPLLLVGQWDSENEKDKIIVATMTQLPYSNAERVATEWADAMGPIIRRGGVWDWKALDFAWKELGPKMASELLSRFRDAAQLVLGTSDPAIALPPDTRWLAPIYGKAHPFSGHLRAGLVTSLIQLALHDQDIPAGLGQRWVDKIVDDLLSGKGIPRADAWCSLAYWLPDLAEASPESFLQCAEGLLGDRDAVAKIFEESGPLCGHSAHTYVLWALERLAWSKRHFYRVLAALAKLAEMDPGGSTANRPMNTLSDIFLPARPRTNTDAKERMAAISALRKTFPDQAWKLAEDLLQRTTRGGIVMNTAEPRWRTDWMTPGAGGTPPARSIQEIAEFSEQLISNMLAWAGDSGDRWAEIVGILSHLGHLGSHAPSMISEIVGKMTVAAATIGSGSGREKLRDEIRKTVNNHRQFSNQNWSLPVGTVNDLEAIQGILQPPDPKEGFKWLFTSWPDVPESTSRNFDARADKTQGLRNDAIATIVESDGIQGIFAFAEMVERPDEVGNSLAACAEAQSLDHEVIEKALSEELAQNSAPPLLRLGLAYVSRRYKDAGPGWLAEILAVDSIAWDSNSLLNLACGLTCESATWDWLAKRSRELSSLYWQRVPIQHLLHPAHDLDRACKELVQAGRHARAVDLAGLYAKTKSGPDGCQYPENFDPKFIVQLLRDTLAHDPKNEWFPPSLGSIGSDVERLLGRLEDVGVGLEELADLEWQWFAVVHRNSQRSSRSLKQLMAKSPKTFVEILSLAFRRRGEPAGESSDEAAKQLAGNAFSLLQDWDRAPGAIYPDGDDKGPADRRFPFPDGKTNSEECTAWVKRARELAAKAGRTEVADSLIGQVLAHSPKDEDGTWPCLAVRLCLEQEDAAEIRNGIFTGLISRRGTYWADGGKSELKFAGEFEEMARRIRPQFPKTATILDQIERYYRDEAKRQVDLLKFEEFDAQA